MLRIVPVLWNNMIAKRKYICIAVLCLFGALQLSAQELNAVVLVKGERVQGVDRRVFDRLQNDLRAFINGRRWIHTSNAPAEKINCSFTLVVTAASAQGMFKGELYVQSFRQMTNNEYKSPLLNLRDKAVEFEYTEYQPLQFDLNFIQDNLTATVAYYAYLVLGLDLDSRMPLGGTACFRNMQQIASSAQSSGWGGWEQDLRRGRVATAVSLNEGIFEDYRRAWFDYHQNGLELSGKPVAVSKEKILSLIESLQRSQEKRPGNILVRMFGDSKLEELSLLLSRASAPEKESVRFALQELYPSRADILN